jgi:hypothetical protein
LGVKANSAKQELEEIFRPNHFVEDKDIEIFKSKHQSLIDDIQTLRDHEYYDKEVFEKAGITAFKSLLAN